jgi:hypothetical protein
MSTLPVTAKVYICAVITGGLVLSVWAFAHWSAQAVSRFIGYLVGALLSSTCKVRLPRMTGTISLNFVLILAAISQLRLPEVIVISAVAAVVQCLWKPQRRPAPVQVVFSLATLILSSTFSYVLSRLALTGMLGDALSPQLALSTGVLYLCNTMLIAAVLCLVERKPLYSLWQNCCFWTFPYYLVGAVFAGLMVVTSRLSGWPSSFLVLPLMVLVYVSYRLHVKRAAATSCAS